MVGWKITVKWPILQRMILKCWIIATLVGAFTFGTGILLVALNRYITGKQLSGANKKQLKPMAVAAWSNKRKDSKNSRD